MPSRTLPPLMSLTFTTILSPIQMASPLRLVSTSMRFPFLVNADNLNRMALLVLLPPGRGFPIVNSKSPVSTCVQEFTISCRTSGMRAFGIVLVAFYSGLICIARFRCAAIRIQAAFS